MTCLKHALLSLPLVASLLSISAGNAAAQPSTVAWAAAISGDWNTATNWSPARVPGTNDLALINAPGNYTVTVSANAAVRAFEISAPSGTQTLNHAAGSLTIAETSLVASNAVYVAYNGTFNGTGDLNIYGALQWQNGFFDGPPTNSVNVYGTAILQTVLSPHWHYLRGRTFRNFGTVRNIYGSFYAGGGCRFINMAGATWIENVPYNNNHQNNYAGTALFLNQGTFIKTNTPYLQVSYPFHNEGVVRVAQGDLYFAGGGNQAGLFDILAGPMGFNGGSNHVYAAEFSGPGKLAVSATTTFATNFTHTRYEQNGGDAYFRAPVSLSVSADISAGNAYFTASSTIQAFGTTNYITGGTFHFNTGEPVPLMGVQFYSGAIAGTDTVNISGPLLWQNGFFDGSGDVNLSGTSTLQTAFAQHYHYLRGRTIRNHGVVNNIYGSFYAGGGCQIVNLPGAVWTENVPYNNVHYNLYAGSAAFVNRGTFVKTNTPYLQINFPFHNEGVVRVAQGDLYFAGGGNQAGLFDILAGPMGFNGGSNHVYAAEFSGPGKLAVSATTTFATNFTHTRYEQNGGDAYFRAPVSLSGSADISAGNAYFTASSTIQAFGTTNYITGGTFHFNTGEPVPLMGVQFYSGAIAGTDTVNISGPLLWQNGFFDGSGDVNLSGTSTLQTAFAQHYHYLRGRTIRNHGVVNNIYGSFYAGGGCQIVNLPGAVWTENVPYNNVHYNLYAGSAAFVNRGTFVKTNTPYLQINFPFHNEGVVRVAQGDLYFAGGGNQAGLFDILAGPMGFNGGSNHVYAAEFSGPGKLAVSATTTFATNFTHTRYEQNGGDAYFRAPVSLSVSADISAGNAYFTASSTIQAFGTTNYITGGTFHFNTGEPVPLMGVQFYSGAIAGTDTVNISGPLLWQNGFFDGSGDVNLSGTSTLQTAFAQHYHYLRGRTIRNHGVVNNIYGSFYAGGGCQIVNLPGAVWTENVPYNNNHQNNYAGSAAFVNLGAFIKTNAFSASWGFVFTNQSAVSVKGGTLSFNGNAIQTAGSIAMEGGGLGGTLLALHGGTLTGSGTLPARLGNENGVIEPGAPFGVMTGTHFTNAPNGFLNIELGGTTPGTNYDQIRLTGNATLNGTLNVTLGNSFQAQLSNSFTVMTYASRVGSFANINPPPGVALTATYSNTSLVLTVTGLSNAPLAITTAPRSQTVFAGDPVVFNVGASGTTPIRFQWQFNGTNISGATNTSYGIPSAIPADSGTYSVLVSDPVGGQTNVSAALTVLPFDGTIYWTNTLGGNWNVATNWSPNRVPGATNTAVIAAGGTYTVTLNSVESVRHLLLGATNSCGTNTLYIPSGSSLALGANSLIETNGSLYLDGLLTTTGGTNIVRGHIDWYRGVLSGAGQTIIASNSTVFFIDSQTAKYIVTNIVQNYGEWTTSRDAGIGPGQLPRFSGGAHLTNHVGGVINMGANGLNYAGAQTPRSYLVNFGKIVASTTSGYSPSSIGVDFINYGTLINNAYTYINRGTNYGTFEFNGCCGGISLFGDATEYFSFEEGTAFTGTGPQNIAIPGYVQWNALAIQNGNLTVGFATAGGANNSADFRLLKNYTNTVGVNIGAGNFTIPERGLVSDLKSLTGAINNGFHVFTISNAGSIHVDNLSFSTRFFANGGVVTVRSNAHFANGSFYAGGELIIRHGATATFTGSAFDAIRIDNLGSAIGNGGTSFSGNTVFRNHPAASLYFAGGSFGGGSSSHVINEGTISGFGGITLNTTNHGSVLANDPLNRTLTVSYLKQIAGETRLLSAVLSGTIDIDAGFIGGEFRVQGTLRNQSIFAPGNPFGLLNITGNYTNGSTGVQHMPVRGTRQGTDFPQVNVNGTAHLAGTLQVSFTNGFFPAIGSSFTALTWTARSGQFDQIITPGYDFDVQYYPNALVLRASNALPIVTVSAPSTQLVCRPFLLTATATDLDGSVTNIAFLLGSNVIASVSGSAGSVRVFYDFPGMVTFSARATDDRGGVKTIATNVSYVTMPLHVISLGGFIETNTAFKLCMLGEAGSNYMVQAAEELGVPVVTNWTDIGLMRFTNGIWRYSDTNAPNFPIRYYRARKEP